MKAIFKYLRNRYWWYFLFEIKQVPKEVSGRCTICDAGNPTILCGNGCDCPCGMNEYLKSISDNTYISDIINGKQKLR